MISINSTLSFFCQFGLISELTSITINRKKYDMKSLLFRLKIWELVGLLVNILRGATPWNKKNRLCFGLRWKRKLWFKVSFISTLFLASLLLESKTLTNTQSSSTIRQSFILIFASPFIIPVFYACSNM